MKKHQDTGIKIHWLLIALAMAVLTASTVFSQSHTWTLRVPGGAIAKYATPAPDRSGWGLQEDVIIYVTEEYTSKDEEGTDKALEKWLGKMEKERGQPSYLQELVDMQQEFPTMQVLWVANLYEGDPMAPIDYLLNHGVNIIGVEMGNETFFQLGYDVNEYIDLMLPVAEVCRSRGLTVYHPAPVAKGVDNTWNAVLASLMPLEDGFVFHYYALEGRDDITDGLPFDFKADKGYFASHSKFIVTEANTKPSGWLGDTEANAEFIDEMLAVGKQEFDIFCIHNGVAPDKFGIIYGTERTGGQKRATHYYSWQKHVPSGKIGLNGAGWFENQTEQSDEWIQEAIAVDCDERCGRRWLWKLFNLRKCRKCQ